MTTTQNYEAGRIILSQLGGRALFMIGAKQKILIDCGVQFKIGRNHRQINHVSVVLDADDTYTITFGALRCKRGDCVPTLKVKAAHSGVYADQLHQLIESETGMYTSL